MTGAHRWANIVSPHRDDAALSLTCTLRGLVDHQVDVRILSCFTLTSWAPRLPQVRVEDIVVLREQEDLQYAEFIGVRGLESLGCEDAPLRSDWRITDGVLQPPDPATKQPLIDALQRKLLAHRRQGCAWFIPMAHSHRDHFLARSAALGAAQGDPVCIYEDVPYSLEVPADEASSRVAMLRDTLGCELSPRTLHDTFDPALWLAGMSHYASQFTQEELESVCQMLAARGGERIWTTEAFDRWIDA